MHAHDARTHTLAALIAGRARWWYRGGWRSRSALLEVWPRRAFLAVSQFVKGVLMERRRSGVENRGGLRWRAAARRRPARAKRGGAGLGRPTKGTALVREAGALAGIAVHFSDRLEADLSTRGLFVYITHSEGLGSGVLLAMAAGVPVVASRVAGRPKRVRPP